MWPVKDPIITSNYGYRTDPVSGKPGQFHPGIDIIDKNADNRLIAMLDGIVVDDKDNYNDSDRWNLSGRNTVGNRFVVKSELDGQVYYWSLYHTAKNMVSVGDKITKGQIVGVYGDVGYSKGAHVHVAVWTEEEYNGSGKNINPLPLLTA